MSNLEKCHDCGILTEEIYFNKHYGFVVCRKCAEYREIIECENCIDKDQRIAELEKENEELKQQLAEQGKIVNIKSIETFDNRKRW